MFLLVFKIISHCLWTTYNMLRLGWIWTRWNLRYVIFISKFCELVSYILFTHRIDKIIKINLWTYREYVDAWSDINRIFCIWFYFESLNCFFFWVSISNCLFSYWWALNATSYTHSTIIFNYFVFFFIK